MATERHPTHPPVVLGVPGSGSETLSGILGRLGFGTGQPAVTAGSAHPLVSALEAAPGYLLVVQHPAAAVAALAGRGHVDEDHALVMWLLQLLAAVAQTDGECIAYLTHDALSQDREACLAHAATTLGLSNPSELATARATLAHCLDAESPQQPAAEVQPTSALYTRWALPAYEAVRAVAAGDTAALAALHAIRTDIGAHLQRLTPNMLAADDCQAFVVKMLAAQAQAAAGAIKVSIIIPCFNKVEYTLKCLTSIVDSNLAGDPGFEVIVIDNASSDETPALLGQLGGDVKVWRNDVNIGFARANNQGALLATGEYLVLLNNDTEVKPGWLRVLVDELDAHAETGIAGARLLYPNGTIQHGGVAIGRDQIPFHIHRGLPPEHPLVMERRAYPVVTAACAAVRRAEFYALGMFDEMFVNGHEDIDLCMRYRESGKAVIYRPDCLAIHHESVSDGRMLSRAQNLERSFLKWRYQLVQDDFTFAFPESARLRAERPLRFAIKLGTPDRTHRNWGDIYYAECLAKALSKLGHHCVLHYLSEWGSDDLDTDVVIHLKGLSEYHPKPYNVNILWMLNHPSLHTREELERYDLVLVASEPHATRLAGELAVPVRPFLQATDPEHFQPNAKMHKDFDLVFVGNNHGAGREDMRRIVADLLPTRYRLGVWGEGWDGKLEPGVLQDRFVPWEKLPEIYSRATIVLNDHQPEMLKNGFVNNRTFDAAACGAVVVSDDVLGISDVLPVKTYQSRTQLHRIVDDILARKDEYAAEAAQLRERVVAEYSFDRRAVELIALVEAMPEVLARIQDRRSAARQVLVDQPAKVSVLMSTYNRREFLPAAIESVLAQSYANVELVLVNDGGVDVADIVAAHQDGRIKYLTLDRRRGKPHAINRGYEAATGRFIAHLDDDDIWYPDHLARLMLPLLTMPTVKLAYSDAYNVTQEREEGGGYRETKRELKHYQQVLLTDLLARNHIQGISVVHRRELFEQAGWMDEHLKVLIDWDMWRRLAALAYPYHVSRVTADHYLREEHGTSGAGHITHLIRHNPVRYAQMARRVMKKDLPCTLNEEQQALLGKLRKRADYIFIKEVAAHAERRGRIERARCWHHVAIRQRPDEIEVWRNLGAMERRAGNPAAALTCHWRAMEIMRNAEDAFAMADVYLDMGRPDKALACVTELKGSWKRLSDELKARLADLKRRAAAYLQAPGPQDLRLLQAAAAQWPQSPGVHFLMHLAAADTVSLMDTLAALEQQSYTHWHLTVIAECAPAHDLIPESVRLSWVMLEPGQSPVDALNAQIVAHADEWIALIRPGDRCDPRLLQACIEGQRSHPEWQLVYTDEDRVTADGKHRDSVYKPDFNLELLRSMPYLGGFGLLRKAALVQCGGFAPMNGMELHDVAFKVYESFGAGAIGHVAQLLFHRADTEVAADEQERRMVASRAALQSHLQRCGLAAQVIDGLIPGSFMLEYRHARMPMVSIVIPTRDGLGLLRACLDSLLRSTAYQNYEILIVDNQSSDPATLQFLQQLPRADARIRLLSYPQPFNFAAINNLAAREARGDYLLLLNNDTLVVQPNWLDRLLAYGQCAGVGAVGARLVFPDQRVQHGGILLGLGNTGIAEHAHLGLPMGEPGYAGRAQVAQDMAAVSASCMLVHKDTYLALGGMDEQHCAEQHADVDLCLRLRERGLRVIWSPFVTLIHHGAATFKRLAAIPRAADEAMFERWLPQLASDPAYNRNLSLHTDSIWEPELDVAIGADLPGMRRPRVLGLGLGSDGAWYYRAEAPLEALQASGLARCKAVPKYARFLRLPSVTELVRNECDALLLYNTVHDDHLEALAKYRRHGRTFMTFGLDDLASELPQKNPFRKTVYKDIKKRIRTALSLCDRLVVTTEPLREAHRKMIDDIVVVPNYLAKSVWLGLESRRGVGRKPRVGWGGALQHQGDLELLHEVVKATAQEVDWVFFGMCPEALRPYVAEMHTAVLLEEYPAKLASLNLDLAVAPLEYNRFNEAKSNLRLLEYGVLGWPVVCTNIHPYQGAPVELVSNNPRAWINAIRERVADPGAAAAEGDRLRQWVLDHWLLEDHLEEWLAALTPGTAIGHRQAPATVVRTPALLPQTPVHESQCL